MKCSKVCAQKKHMLSLLSRVAYAQTPHKKNIIPGNWLKSSRAARICEKHQINNMNHRLDNLHCLHHAVLFQLEALAEELLSKSCASASIASSCWTKLLVPVRKWQKSSCYCILVIILESSREFNTHWRQPHFYITRPPLTLYISLICIWLETWNSNCARGADHLDWCR